MKMCFVRALENSPVLKRRVGRSSRLSPVGTAESSVYPFHSSLRDLLPFVLVFPALKRWAILNRPLRGRQVIFVRGGELEKVMGHFHENAVSMDGSRG